MTFAFKHGRRILKKPFKEALQRWHIRIIPFSTQMCVITLTLLITMSKLASSDHQISENWPLEHHKSPWLHKEFIEYYKSDSEMINKCPIYDSLDPHIRLKSDPNRTQLKNSTQTHLISSSNGSEPKPSNSINNNDFSTVLTTSAIDGITATSPASQFTDSLGFFNNQCLSFDENSTKRICDSLQGVHRMELIEQYHLKYCHRYSLSSVLSSHAKYSILYNSSRFQCENILSELVMLDNIINHLTCEYDLLLERFDCQRGFSVKWSCNDCRKVYRDWVCSMLMPFHVEGIPIKPCQTFCERVEQRCPHLHPYGKGQYAGEPVFLCIDPNIPFNPSITPDIPYAESSLCYDICHLINSEEVLGITNGENIANDGPVKCIDSSELYNNNKERTATTTTISTESDSSVFTPVPPQPKWSDNELRHQLLRTSSVITPTSVPSSQLMSVSNDINENSKSNVNHERIDAKVDDL